MRTAYTFFLFFFISANLFAQPNSIFFDRISTDNGLISNRVTSVLKDRDGVLWIGTEDGLSKYNGSSFVNYYHSNDKNSLKGNAVIRLMQDKEGKIWIGSQDVISYIDPHTDKITNIDFPYRITTSASNVNGIVQSSYDGRIWVATMRGLFTVDQKNNTLIPFVDKDSVLIKWDLTDIVLDGKESAWITCRYGLLKVNLQTKAIRLFVPLGRADIPENKDKNILTSVVEGKDETLWVGNWGAGLQQFDKRTEKFTMYLPEPKLGVRGDANIILDIMPSQFPDEKDMLWLATGSTGFAIFNTINKQFKLYSNTDYYNGSQYTTPTGVYSLYYASPEGLWIGTTNGLYRYDKYLQTFQLASFKKTLDNRHCLSEVLTAYVDPIDNTGKTYWMSTWSCGSYIYNAAKDSFQSLPSWMSKWVTDDSILSCIHRDKQNKLWIGLNYKRLLSIDEKNKTATEIFCIDNETKQKRSIVAWHFMEDSKGNLWVGGSDGLYVVKKNSSEAIHIIKREPQLPKELSITITGITEDANGNIWFCSKADGHDGKSMIGYIDKELQEKKYFFAKNNNALPDAYSYSGMAYTPYNNTVWAGSDKGMVNWKATTEPAFKLLTRADGICSDRIYRIAKGTHNSIWAATANGVSYYDTVGQFHNFYMEQGLSENDVRRIFPNAITGEVFLAFPEKLCLVNSQFSQSNQSPPVIISSLKVFNKTYTKDGQSFYPDKNAVSLSYSENNITISFSALSYTAPHQNRYAYKMGGLDKEWIYTNTNSVTYSQLPPGDYTFRIKACNSMGVWNEEGTYLDIHVATPFYRTAWFIIGCILLAGYLVYLIYKYRVAQIRKMYGIRNDIARDLHDEIGSTLTSINILSKVSELNLEKDKEATLKHLKQISEQSQNMQQSMSDIVWAIKPDEDKIGNMTERMLEYVTHVLETKNVNVSFDVDETLVEVVLQMQQRRDFFMLFKEAINNIAKHADAKNVTIKLSRQNKHIILLIKDDGVGFDEVASKFSNGLKNMKRRAEEMGGRIDIDSKVGRGTTVTLSIPQQ